MVLLAGQIQTIRFRHVHKLVHEAVTRRSQWMVLREGIGEACAATRQVCNSKLAEHTVVCNDMEGSTATQLHRKAEPLSC